MKQERVKKNRLEKKEQLSETWSSSGHKNSKFYKKKNICKIENLKL